MGLRWRGRRRIRLTDSWALRGSLEGVDPLGVGDKQAGTAAGTEHMDAALAGVTYTIDVLRLVPYATLQFGVAQFGGPLAAPLTMFASELGVGGDYYLTRQLRAGVSFQYLYRPQDLFQNPEGLGNSRSLSPRLRASVGSSSGGRHGSRRRRLLLAVRTQARRIGVPFEAVGSRRRLIRNRRYGSRPPEGGWC